MTRALHLINPLTMANEENDETYVEYLLVSDESPLG